jgi:hypothetical protein
LEIDIEPIQSAIVFNFVQQFTTGLWKRLPSSMRLKNMCSTFKAVSRFTGRLALIAACHLDTKNP